LSCSLHRALTLSYKIIVRLTSVLKSKNLSSGFPIVLKTIQLMSAAAIGPRLLVMQHSSNLSQVQLALQLLLWEMSESMGNHDSEVVDASSVD
jgi:hypothetical protein